jgi:DNA-binding transcriptional ArsR family regulator
MLNPKEIEKLQSLMKKKDERLPIVFGALSDPRRCLIFRSFLKKDRLCVSDISRTFHISMSLASQHLKILEITGLLVKEKEGRTVYYRPNLQEELVTTIISAIK